MKHLVYLLSLTIFSFFISSCVIEEKCWGSSCSDPINFQLIDKATQQDLVTILMVRMLQVITPAKAKELKFIIIHPGNSY
jgi:hypothetical protein